MGTVHHKVVVHDTMAAAPAADSPVRHTVPVGCGVVSGLAVPGLACIAVIVHGVVCLRVLFPDAAQPRA